MNRAMARFDWDRLRRTRPLDGADARVDTDGAWVWEKGDEDQGWVKPLDARRLRAGIVVRRAKERAAQREEPAATTEAPDLVECPRCHAKVSRRRLLRHTRIACRGGGRAPT